MAMPKGILIAAVNIVQAAEDEFHDWYDTEHLPERQRIPGFLSCQRWIGAPDRKISVVTYDLDGVGVLKSPGYLAISGDNVQPWSKRVTSRVERLMRFEGDQILPGDRLPPKPNSTSGTTPSTSRRSPPCRASSARAASGRP
jgi:hypothetical protein